MVTVIGVLLIIMGIFLVISVLMQSSKNHRISGSVAGGAETFFGKQKGKTLDALFNKLTTIVTIIFVILVLALCFILPTAEEAYIEQVVEDMSKAGFNITADDLVVTENGGYDYADYEAFVAKNPEMFTVEETPAEGEEAPAEGEEAPVEGEEAPAEGETVETPAEGEETSVEETEAPAEEAVETPVEETEAPAEEVAE